MAQQTAVDWLVNKIYMVIPNEERNFLEGLREQAKAIEKEQREEVIELPSDEEINEVAMVVYGFNAKDIKDVLEYKAFKRGAKWMRNKIQGGNNGHI